MPFDFIADEEAAPKRGFDFTPDTTPATAVAPRPIVRPPPGIIDQQFQAQTEERADLFAQQKEARQQGDYWEGVADRIGNLERFIVEPLTRPLSGAVGRAADVIVPGEPVIEPTLQQAGIHLPKAGAAETPGGKIAAGLYNATTDLISGLTSPDAVALLPAATSKPVLTAWISQMAGHQPERVMKAAQLFKEGKTQEGVQEVTAGVLELGMAEMGRRHVVREPGTPGRADLREQPVDPALAQETALRLTDPRQAQRQVTLPESMRQLAKEPSITKATYAIQEPGRKAEPAGETPQVPEVGTKAPEPVAEAPKAAEPVAAESPLPEQFRTKPIAETAELVKSLPTEEITAYKGDMAGGATGFMWDLGARAKTVEDVAALRKMAEEASAETKAFMAAGDLEGAMKVIGRQPAEAYEFATGVKLDGTPKWETLEKMAAMKGKTYKPPVPDLQYLKAKGLESAPVPEPAKAAEPAATPATPAAAPAVPAAEPLPTNLPALARLRIRRPELREQIDAKIAELQGAAAPAAAALKELPPVPAGHVRLFHGEGGPQGGGTGGAFYTSNIGKASTFGPDISWVDVPTERAQAAFARAKESAFPGGDNFILEAADISRAKKIGKKVEPPTHVLDEPAPKPAAAVKTAEVPSAVQAEGTAPSLTPPKGIAASVRQPGKLLGGETGAVSLAPLQSAARTAGAVGRAAKESFDNVVRFYSEPLTERLAADGGANAKGFANMSKEIAQRSKEIFGSITPVLDPALEATGKMNRTTTWLNDIAQVSNKRWGYRNAQRAVEGPIANVPAEHRAAVDLIKSANLAIGQLAQPVVPGFRATGRYQRPPTAFLVDTIRSGKGPNYELLANALAEQNRIPPVRVKSILNAIKKEFDEPGSQQTLHRISQEFERRFPKFPTDLKVRTPIGDVWMPILHAKPFEYLKNAAESTAQRVAFLERVPQGTLKGIRDQVVPELKNPAAFDDLVRALHGLPVNEPLRMFSPGSIQQMMASGANRVLSDVFSSLKLTASAIYNIPETVLGNTPAFLGWRNFIEGATTLPQKHARLENMGAINRAIYNFSIDPKAPIRTALSNFRQGLRKATAQQFFNELQEKLAASTAQVFSERAQGSQLSVREQGLFTEAATAMGFERPAAKRMAEGRGTAEQYDDFVRRAPAFTTGGNIQPAEMSRFGGNRVLTSLFRFQSYPMMKLNAFRKAYVNFAEGLESKDPGRIKASGEQLAKFLFGTTAQGAATAFLAALLTGRGGGVGEVADEAADEPGAFIFDSVASGIGGPAAAINYAVGTGNAGDLLNPKNINAASTFPGRIYFELKQMFNTEGPYAGMSVTQAAKKYARTKIPAGRMINNALQKAGLISGTETRKQDFFRIYDKWVEKQDDPKLKADYERRKGQEFGESKYDTLDAALLDGNEARAIKAIEDLRAEGNKPRDILERMRPFTGEGIDSRAKPLFQGDSAKFRNSLTPEQREEYQRALDERRQLWQAFLKAWRKRGNPAPAASKPAFEFVPDAP